MSTPADLTDTINAAAAEPLEAKADGVEAVAHPLPDLVAADQYLAQKRAASRKTSGIRFVQLVPPGA